MTASSKLTPSKLVPLKNEPVIILFVKFAPLKLALEKSILSNTAFDIFAPSNLVLTAYAFKYFNYFQISNLINYF